MHEVTQTILAGDKRALGNCLQACVASIYELPMEAVPHFVQFDDWRAALNLWVKGKGGYLLMVWSDRLPNPAPVQERPLLAFGESPRGDFSHSVVWSNGILAHDPHPSRAGLSGPPYELWDILPSGDVDG